MTEREALTQSEQHQDWCASLTQMLASMPPKPAPCNCKPAQPEQEPVVKWDASAPMVVHPHPAFQATPPQRTWVGLTDEEIAEIMVQIWSNNNISVRERSHRLARDIEAKLKEKNT